jgi:large subunit ribosomal protein L7/L12
MAMSCRFAAQRCASQLRSTSSVRVPAQMLRVSSTTRRWNSTEAAAAPSNPKIAEIVDKISQLTLLETADLVSSLKVGGGSSIR